VRFVSGAIVTVGVTLSAPGSLPQAALSNETKTIDPRHFCLFGWYSPSLDFDITQHIALTGEQHEREREKKKKKYNIQFIPKEE